MSHNEIRNTGLKAGMGLNYTGVPMSYELVNCYFEYNVIDSTGYNGIHFGGDSIFIRNNIVSNFCMTVDDGAAIYTSGEASRLYYNRFLENNIVLNGLGAGEGTTDPGYSAADGIYMDDRTSYVNITGNTVAGTGRGIYLHNANHINLTGNTSFDNDKQLLLNHDENYPDFPITNCRITGNTFLSKFSDQIVAEFLTTDNGIYDFGTLDSNYYCRPVDDDATINTWYLSDKGEVREFVSLGTWQSTFNHDINSMASPFTVPSFTVSSTPGSNRFPNGNFDSNASGWYCWAEYTNCDMAWDENASLDGGCLKLGFSGSSGHPDGSMLAMGNIGGVEAGKSYVLRFSMVAASPGKTIEVIMRRDADNSEDLTSAHYITLDTDRREYELFFTPNSDESSARIDFVITEAAGSVWIDNLELFRAEVNRTDMDQNIILLFNPHEWVMDFQTDGEFYDVEGNIYSNFTLQPFTSLILINPNPNHGKVIQSAHESIREEIELYPNPAEELLYIRTPRQGAGIIGIYDLTGTMILEVSQAGRESIVDISSLKPDMYILMVKEEGSISSLKFFKY